MPKKKPKGMMAMKPAGKLAAADMTKPAGKKMPMGVKPKKRGR